MTIIDQIALAAHTMTLEPLNHMRKKRTPEELLALHKSNKIGQRSSEIASGQKGPGFALNALAGVHY